MKEERDDRTTKATGTAPDAHGDYSPSGVDRSLIRWMLSLSPSERLRAVQEQLNAIEAWKEQLHQD